MIKQGWGGVVLLEKEERKKVKYRRSCDLADDQLAVIESVRRELQVQRRGSLADATLKQ